MSVNEPFSLRIRDFAGRLLKGWSFQVKILFVSSEVVPFSKTGGLADVAGALPPALRRLGHDVRIVTPRYRITSEERFGIRPILHDIRVHFQSESHVTQIRTAPLPGTDIPVYFVNYEPYFDRANLYTEAGKDYPDNPQRFALFCMSALWMLRALDWKPDVIHCNDWQTGLIPTYLMHHPDLKFDEFYKGIRVLYTIHNLAYQGRFPREILNSLGLGWEVYTMHGLEFYGDINLMKAGIVFSDEITTVSKTYAHEIQTDEYGCGLDGVLRTRSVHLTGILNGIDYTVWNPETDSLIPAKFGPGKMAGKARCKKALQAKCGLPEKADIPLIGVISRLADQKGFDLIAAIAQDLFQMDIQMVILGTGEPKYHEIFQKIGKKHPDKASIHLTFDNQLAHEIEAGCDMFLMPSSYEPCGLNQLYSLKYGTVPIVRKTGGLADSITDATSETIKDGSGTGFVFEEYSPKALFETIGRAVNLFSKAATWRKIRENGMAKDFSWDASARMYEGLYRRMITG